jgi:hypothetical protein
MPFTEYVKAFTELGFPVGVAVYLLVYQSKQMDRLRSSLVEVQIGLRLILDKLDAMGDYDRAVAEFKAKKEKDNE